MSLRAEDAVRLGIATENLTYDIPTSTANGRSYVAGVMLDTLRVGDITVRNVPAFVSKPGRMTETLLGQSFMAKLKGYRVEDNELILMGE